jgi:potassium efflux system protein
MRATTITNWDRQEFVVPNKTLITNTLLNWTLTEPLNRLVIPVGVAYGSDTDEARRILLEVAADNPRILDDPEPKATFEQFGDSSLNLVLRGYLPDMEHRLATITELHAEIHRRFAAAGVQIPFPQRDLHLRDGRLDIRNPATDVDKEV